MAPQQTWGPHSNRIPSPLGLSLDMQQTTSSSVSVVAASIIQETPNEESPDETKSSHRCCRYVAGLGFMFLVLSGIVAGGVMGGWPADYHRQHLEPSLLAMRAGLILCIWVFGHSVNAFVWRRAQLHNVFIFESIPQFFLNFEELFVV